MRNFPLPKFLILFAGVLIAFAPAARAAEEKKRDVIFLSTSDTHYVETERKNNRNESNRLSILEINKITEASWPKELGGDPVKRPRGIVVLGDCIDDGDKKVDGKVISIEQYKFWLADFGLDGTDGVIKIPTFEGWGNHDGPPAGKEKNGFSFQAHLKERNQVRKEKGMISNLSDNGLHYSWDWDDVHLVQLNIYPADQQRAGVHYSAEWHNPQGALSFLRKDLAEKVGDSGRPVILMSHCGFDTDWWSPEDWREVFDVAKQYNVVLYLYGHSGTGIRPWAPAGEPNKWMCINDGQLEKGFFVIELTNDRLRAAMRRKTNYKVDKGPDGSLTSSSDGNWEWHWIVDRKISPPK